MMGRKLDENGGEAKRGYIRGKSHQRRKCHFGMRQENEMNGQSGWRKGQKLNKREVLVVRTAKP
jgi:hypothetical protein